MGKVKLLLNVIGNLRSLADSLQAVADAHRQTVSRLMKEMRAGESGTGKEGQDV